VQGSEAGAGMRRLCASDVDVEPGRVVYTLLCNPHGGIEMDPTVTRLDEDRFLVVAPTLYQRRTEWLLRRGLPEGAAVTDVTSGYAVIHVAGPRSRELLSRVTDADLGNEAFGFMRAREIEVGYAKAWTLRVSYTGELGWELYVPTEFATGVYDRLVSAGADLGLRHAGAFAFDALRLERGFRSWGHDVGAVDDPFAGGLGFAVHLDGGREFVGAEALARLREAPRERRLVSVRVEDPTAMLWHGESVVDGERRIGHVTSGGYGHTLGRPVGLAWVRAEVSELAEVEIRARRVPATLSAAPFYDPKGERARM
jgi:heterotetrameric sarcosine oxidase gamma subunit